MQRIRQPLEVDLVAFPVSLVEQLSAVFDVVEVALSHAASRALDFPGQPVELGFQVPQVHSPMVFSSRRVGTCGMQHSCSRGQDDTEIHASRGIKARARSPQP